MASEKSQSAKRKQGRSKPPNEPVKAQSATHSSTRKCAPLPPQTLDEDNHTPKQDCIVNNMDLSGQRHSKMTYKAVMPSLLEEDEFDSSIQGSSFAPETATASAVSEHVEDTVKEPLKEKPWRGRPKKADCERCLPDKDRSEFSAQLPSWGPGLTVPQGLL